MNMVYCQVQINDEEIYEMNHILNCRYEIKWSYDPCSYERNFSNCIEKPEKIRTSTGFEPVTLQYWCDALTNCAMKPLTLRTVGSFVGSNVPVMNESTMKWYMKWIIYYRISSNNSRGRLFLFSNQKGAIIRGRRLFQNISHRRSCLKYFVLLYIKSKK